MVVQHNLQAMNANRMLNITTGSQSKSAEKLSSGYRINRAADDAAGLTISEKMRKQIRGLDQASSNAEDGVSAVQTAEGALTEVHSMLQRMNELAVQASNGTNSQDDRDAIQAEIEQLTTEIDRVAETTKFNETYLLKGDADGNTATNTVNAHDAGLKGTLTGAGTGTATFTADKLAVGDKVSIGGTEYTIVDSAKADDYKDINGYTAASGDKITDADGNKYTYYAQNDNDANGTKVVAAGWYQDGDSTTTAVTQANILKVGNFLNGKKLYGDGANNYTATAIADVVAGVKALGDGKTVTIADADGSNAKTYTVGVSTDAANDKYTADDLAKLITEGKLVDDGTKKYYVLPKASDKDNEISLSEAYSKMADELKTASDIGTDSKTQSTVTNNGDGTFSIEEGSVKVAKGLSFNLHVGADADMTNKINVNIDSMSAASLGIKGINVSDTTGKAATYAVDAIADALSKVSSQRSALGAVQNRLEHTIDNLDNVVENTTSAESRIRDVDMAEEMVEYSKNNILAQAGQSMLAQANQATQGVLSLLG